MKINYSEIKNSFWKYLEQLQDPSIDLTEIDTLSIFAFSDKLKEFLASEYNLDESIFSYDLEAVLEMPVSEDGQFIEETEEATEIPEVPTEETEAPVEGEEVPEPTEATEENPEEPTEETEQTEDDENNLFKEMLNDFLKNDDVKNVVDANKDGVLSNEEIDNFFKQIAGNDGNADDISLTDIQSAYEKIKDGSFVLGEAGAGEQAEETPETPETPTTTETEETTPTTPTTPTNPGNNGGGTNPGNNNGGNDNKDDGKVNYASMSLEELQTKRTEKEGEIAKTQETISDIYSGKDEVVGQAQATADEMKQAYEAAVDADEKLTKEQKQAIKDNDAAIADKELEVSAAQQLSNETAGKISTTENEIQDLASTLSALNESKTKLESQTSEDSEEKAEIQSKLEAVKAKITEVEQQKRDKEAEKTQLETDKQAYDEIVTEKKGELDALKTKRTELTKDASDETKTALTNWEQAEASVEATKAARLQTVQGTLATQKAELDEINAAYRDKQAAATKKEYKVGQADLFTDSPMEVTAVNRNGMKYLLIGPKDADPNEELPVMVYLHGSGEKGSSVNSLNSLKGASLLNMMMNHQDEYGQTFNGYILMPQTPDYWDRPNRAQEVRDIVNEFGQTHAIDRDNITIAGHSMGGIGALYMAGTNDDHFFSRALVLSGYNCYGGAVKNINIPVMGFGESGNNTKGLIGNIEDASVRAQCQYYGSSAGHGAVPRDAFGRKDSDGMSLVYKFLYPDYVG